MLPGWGRALCLIAACLAGGCEESGEEGNLCKSDSMLAPPYCDGELLCNSAVEPFVCQAPMSRKEGETCSSDALCATGLWCNGLESKCQPRVGENQPCPNPYSCRPGLTCTRSTDGSPATCRPQP